MKADLRDFTLCAADSANIALTVRAFNQTLESCNFGDVLFFTHAHVEGPFRTVKIDRLTRKRYRHFRLKEVGTFIDTPFALFIEWDGYVTEPRAWDPKFREYDFIGARWPEYSDGMAVGNGGFCLQSKKLMNALSDARFAADTNEYFDKLFCRAYRSSLEREFNIRFASEPIADLFSYENNLPIQPTFGFHGLANMWRHMPDAKLLEIVDQLDPYVFKSRHFTKLILEYSLQCKFGIVEQLYAILRKYEQSSAALGLFREHLQQPHADAIFGLCERLVMRA